ncbi:LuxR family transcriptional regulator [Burkholderia mallei]|uniref:LuxR family transcriptional regulator n=2 Tax=pseudomallei group TaxID=111527 RepID=A0AAX1X4I8_BURML|nr:LuxR family transcriptional regulator [Burkholderia pseudomallei]EEC35628.1 transcriptional regulator, LuxR family [Burkholderia pseudomallei 576]EET09161.1 transcriptional regulator, LuxR family [Burkholderia pseudomallei 1710a]EMP77599.1 LuxR family transcriptional regulator [Burkholderia pseudomallei MSHR1043]RKO01065.1 LuxR family transcriptional regulator [Burkholderia mallei]
MQMNGAGNPRGRAQCRRVAARASDRGAATLLLRRSSAPAPFKWTGHSRVRARAVFKKDRRL